MTDLEKRFDFEYTTKEATYRYMLLDRLRTDCNYFLGNGNRNEKNLWAGNVEDHINVMKELWHSFSLEEKPEWLTLEQIDQYAAQMKVRGKL